jgi:hypothetical protein
VPRIAGTPGPMAEVLRHAADLAASEAAEVHSDIPVG